MTYVEKLKDPRWQKKRLEILNRDEWKCRVCGDKTSTLHVHHLDYKNGKEPWDYNNDTFIAICEDCHESEHRTRKEYEQSLLSLFRSKGFMADDVFTIIEIVLQTSIETLNALRWCVYNKYGVETGREIIPKLLDSYSEYKLKHNITD